MCSFLIEYIIFSLSCTVARARRKVPSVENINKYVFIKVQHWSCLDARNDIFPSHASKTIITNVSMKYMN